MYNSIRLKGLQVVNGALRKVYERLRFLFLFQKGFFLWGGEDGVIPPLSKGGFFFKGLG